MKKWINFTTILSILVLSLICVINNYWIGKARLLPGDSIPSREIVYWNRFDSEHLPLVFISTDGNNPVYLDVRFPVGVGFMSNPIKRTARILYNPIWSDKGEYLGLLINDFPAPDHGYPVIISTDGQFYFCGRNSPSTPYRFQITEGTNILISDFNDAHNRIILYDMKECQVTEILYEAHDDEILQEAYLSSQGWLVVSARESSNDRLDIYAEGKKLVTTLKLKTGEMSWSKDGERLALIIHEDPLKGLYVMKKDGTDLRRITDADSSPSWSPDGKWVIFDRKRQIIKVNVLTGEEIILGNGFHPNWRWIIP